MRYLSYISKYILLISLITLLSTSHAYELAPMNWSYEAQPISKKFTFCPSILFPRASRIIRLAASQWNNDNVVLEFTEDACIGDSTFPPLQEDGVSRIDFGTLRSHKIAETSIQGNGPSHMARECDLRFSLSAPWHLGRGKPKIREFDLYSVALHEFGHCLGLGHSLVPGSVMVDHAVSGFILRKLQPDDIAGIHRIYGK